MSTPPTWTYFPKPEIIIYRFLNVLKSRNQLVFEIVRHVEENLNQFLRKYWNEPELIDLIDALRNESIDANTDNPDSPPVFADTQPITAIQDSVVLYVLWRCYKSSNNAIDIGCKTIALKKLIHWVLLDGIVDSRFLVNFDQTNFQMIQYAHRNQIRQYVYSSCCGQLFQDKRLLSYTTHGDLTKYLNFLDRSDNPALSYGPREKQTYVQLADRFDVAPSAILLVAFSKTECKKAARAGYMVAKIREVDPFKPKYYTIRVIDHIGVIRFAGAITIPPQPGPSTTTTRTTQTIQTLPTMGSRKISKTNPRNRSNKSRSKKSNRSRRKTRRQRSPE